MSLENKLIRNLDALETAMQEICDAETVKKIIARKRELQNKKGNNQ